MDVQTAEDHAQQIVEAALNASRNLPTTQAIAAAIVDELRMKGMLEYAVKTPADVVTAMVDGGGKHVHLIVDVTEAAEERMSKAVGYGVTVAFQQHRDRLDPGLAGIVQGEAISHALSYFFRGDA